MKTNRIRFTLFFLMKPDRKIAFLPRKKNVKKSFKNVFFRWDLQDLGQISAVSKKKSENSSILRRTNLPKLTIFQLSEVISRRNRRIFHFPKQFRTDLGDFSPNMEEEKMRFFRKLFENFIEFSLLITKFDWKISRAPLWRNYGAFSGLSRFWFQ